MLQAKVFHGIPVASHSSGFWPIAAIGEQ